jgi:antitoxin component YwqK of YwqJK toxin-antitoxin module
MINIKRLFFVCLLFSCFLFSNSIKAQNYNKFDENKKRTGTWKKYYPNKRLRYIGKFENGKEVGLFKFYSMTSSLYLEATKTFHKDSDSVSVKYFHENGKKRGNGMLFGRDKVGKWIYYYKEGTVFSEEFYIEGKLSGNVIIYFKSNGKIAEQSEYKDGLLHGSTKNYSDQGVLIEDVLFQNGKANGLASYYELSGSLKERGNYKDGKRIGKWEFYLDGEIVDDKQKKESLKNNVKNQN